MRSWLLVPLLLAALCAARARLGSAEGEPLPQSLVDLVRNSPISSVDDLKLLLQQEADVIEDEEDEHDVPTNHTRSRYTRSLVEAPPAQQAACKVRTEVMEVTRSMLDRRNANFVLWPSCVEVQRCSGCCNTRALQCVPIATSSRYLQVIKIQYINQKVHYEKAIISVEDHVSCRCQYAASSLPVSHSSVQSNTNPPRPAQQVHPAPAMTHAKADLHRHDDLKHNQQQRRPEEREPVSRQWQQGSYTQLVNWPQPRVHHASTHVQSGAQQPVSRWPSEAGAGQGVMGSTQQLGHGSGYDGSREDGGVHVANGGGEVHHSDHAPGQHQHPSHHQPHDPHQSNPGGAEDQDLRTQYRLGAPQSDSASPPGSPTPPPILTTTTDQKHSATSQTSTEVTNPKRTETATVAQTGGVNRGDGGSANSGDPAGAQLANQGKDRDSNATTDGGRTTEEEEEERRQKLLEMVQSEPDKQARLHPHQPQQRPKPTAFKTALSTVASASPLGRQVPFRPASPRRRRKHRKRISKAAIRAMIM